MALIDKEKSLCLMILRTPFLVIQKLLLVIALLVVRRRLTDYSGCSSNRPEGERINNLSIIGMHCIGKTSLVKNVFDLNEENKYDIYFKNRLVITINLKDYEDSRSLFCDLLQKSLDAIIDAQYPLDSAAIQRLSSHKPRETSFWVELRNVLEKFFKEVRRAGIYILFILEEFDHARTVFAKDYQGFERLRQLSQECDVSYITLSRRFIEDIEKQTGAGSTLAAIFADGLYLLPFDNQELDEYFGIFSSLGIEITPKMRERIGSFYGGHPYLLAMLGYKIVEAFHQKRKINIEEIFKESQISRDRYFANIVRRLKKDQNLNTLLKVIFGPRIDITKKDINDLKFYGLIKENTGKKSLQGTNISLPISAFQRVFNTI